MSKLSLYRVLIFSTALALGVQSHAGKGHNHKHDKEAGESAGDSGKDKDKDKEGPKNGLPGTLAHSRMNSCDFSDYKFDRVQLISANSAQSSVFNTYNLYDAAGLARLKQDVAQLIVMGEAQKESPTTYRGIEIGGSVVKALKQIKEMIPLLSGEATLPDTNSLPYFQAEARAAITELIYSINTNYLSPIQKSADVSELIAKSDTAIGRNSISNLAKNLYANGVCSTDQRFPIGSSASIDPQKSTFWEMPTNIATKNLFHGYGRNQFQVDPNSLRCKFKKGKNGYGVHPGFTGTCVARDGSKRDYKLRWGAEVHTGPFGSRIFNALGFNTAEFDFAPHVYLDYDRKLFLKFASPKSLLTSITVLGFVPIYNLQVGGEYYSPFKIIEGAKIKDGGMINVEELKQRLFKVRYADKVELDGNNYNVPFEESIEYLVLKGGSYAEKPDDQEDVGGWSFGSLGFFGKNDSRLPDSGLGHENRREIRGSGLLAAWLNSFDMRWDNTRLSLFKKSGGGYEMRHVYSDLGAGLGMAASFMSTSNGVGNHFDWAFTEAKNCEALNVSGQTTEATGNCLRYKFSIYNFKTDDYNKAYDQMNFQDAQWMGRYIAQLTRPQIQQALVASGFSAAEVYIYTAKLINRRNKMVRDLNLGFRDIEPSDEQNVSAQDIYAHSRDFTQQPLFVKIPAGPGGQLVNYKVPDEGCRLDRGQLVGCKDTTKLGVKER